MYNVEFAAPAASADASAASAAVRWVCAAIFSRSLRDCAATGIASTSASNMDDTAEYPDRDLIISFPRQASGRPDWSGERNCKNGVRLFGG
jgi:hypothetical protein